MSSRKTDIVFAVLASSIYRRWYWANYATAAAQAALRSLWAPHLSGLSSREIREGLAKWAAERGETDPPTPEAFVQFCRPVHTQASRAGFAGLRDILRG